MSDGNVATYVHLISSILHEFKKVESGEVMTVNFSSTSDGRQVLVTNNAHKLLRELSGKIWLDMEMRERLSEDRLSNFVIMKFLDIYVSDGFGANMRKNVMAMLASIDEIFNVMV